MNLQWTPSDVIINESLTRSHSASAISITLDFYDLIRINNLTCIGNPICLSDPTYLSRPILLDNDIISCSSYSIHGLFNLLTGLFNLIHLLRNWLTSRSHRFNLQIRLVHRLTSHIPTSSDGIKRLRVRLLLMDGGDGADGAYGGDAVRLLGQTLLMAVLVGDVGSTVGWHANARWKEVGVPQVVVDYGTQVLWRWLQGAAELRAEKLLNAKSLRITPPLSIADGIGCI